MSPSDLARLEIAKRAYQATQPRAAEVQTGVRRARLWLGRPKPRRNWFSKGLVLVVLAVGSLAYAKPQALGELVQNAIRPVSPLPGRHLGGGASDSPREASKPAAVARQRGSVTTPAVIAPGVTTPPITNVVGAAESRAAVSPSKAGAGAVESKGVESKAAEPKAVESKTAEPKAVEVESAAIATAPAVAAEGTSSGRRKSARNGGEPSTSEREAGADWGRVGRALAQGDDVSALSALAQLSENAERGTRDKADLGRAQLFMAHGKTQQACELARSLLDRHAGSRIERQAQSLLKSCTAR